MDLHHYSPGIFQTAAPVLELGVNDFVHEPLQEWSLGFPTALWLFQTLALLVF